MRLKSKLLILATTLALANSVSASHGKIPPSNCPTVSAIQREKLSILLQLPSRGYFGLQKNSYDTDYLWYFAIGFFNTETEDEAFNSSLDALATVSGHPSPIFDEEGYWFCYYNASPGLYAIAFYQDLIGAPLRVKYLFSKLA